MTKLEGDNQVTGNAPQQNAPQKNAPKRKRTPKWIRQPGRMLSEPRVVVPVVARLIRLYLNFVVKTNSFVVEPEDPIAQITDDLPVIGAVWHGQHILLPAVPIGLNGSVMISRSIDGEITARLVELYGNHAIRASGGRNQKATLQKGGMIGFREMLEALANGENVVQTADVPKGTPRRAGAGIIQLAQRSGRPIVPLALASSRRKTFHNAWDRAALNLPFGKSAICMGNMVKVPADADEKMLEEKRLELQNELNRITARAYELTGGAEGVTFDHQGPASGTSSGGATSGSSAK